MFLCINIQFRRYRGSAKSCFFKENTSDHERSIILVDIMNAIGFSMSEREIHRMHLRNVLVSIFRTTDKDTSKVTGSASDGMCGDAYNNQSHHNFDCLFTTRKIKQYTPRKNNINNPPLLLLHDNEEYGASFLVEEDDNFPGYVKLSLVEMETCTFLDLCRRMSDDKQYLSNSIKMVSFYDQPVKSSKNFEGLSPPCQKREINRPIHTIHATDRLGHTRNTDIVHCIYYDMWPN